MGLESARIWMGKKVSGSDPHLPWTLQHISNVSGRWSGGYFLGESCHHFTGPRKSSETTPSKHGHNTVKRQTHA